MATRQWTRTDPKYGVITHTCVMAAGDSSADLQIPDYSDKTIHVFASSWGDSTVSVLGLNDTTATAQALHRVNDPTLTFSSLSAEVMALLLENPLVLRASTTGTTGTNLTVVVVSKRNL